MFADLRTNVHNFWDRGLLGMALDPNFPTTPYVYVLYTYDHVPQTPRHRCPSGEPSGATSDGCPSPPGATGDGCVVSGRLSRLQAIGQRHDGPGAGADRRLVPAVSEPLDRDRGVRHGRSALRERGRRCELQLRRLRPGRLARSTLVAIPRVAWRAAMTPTHRARGRARGLRTSARPAIPWRSTEPIHSRRSGDGRGPAVNPLAGSSDLNAAGSSPMACATRSASPLSRERTSSGSATSDGATGRRSTSSGATDGAVDNYGWPCYEGTGPTAGYDGANLTLCESLYAQPRSLFPPFFAYNHAAVVVPGETCPTGSSSIAGMAFETGSSFPAATTGALLRRLLTGLHLAYAHRCNGAPDPATRVDLRRRGGQSRWISPSGRTGRSTTRISTAVRFAGSRSRGETPPRRPCRWRRPPPGTRCPVRSRSRRRRPTTSASPLSSSRSTVSLPQRADRAPVLAPWNTTATPNGSHGLTATARDVAASTTTSSPLAVMVSNAAGATRYVSDLPVVSQTNGWGRSSYRSNGEVVMVGRSRWAVSCMRRGWVCMRLPTWCTRSRLVARRFAAQVGVDDEVPGRRVGRVRDRGRRHEACQQPASDGGRQCGLALTCRPDWRGSGAACRPERWRRSTTTMPTGVTLGSSVVAAR